MYVILYNDNASALCLEFCALTQVRDQVFIVDVYNLALLLILKIKSLFLREYTCISPAFTFEECLYFDHFGWKELIDSRC